MVLNRGLPRRPAAVPLSRSVGGSCSDLASEPLRASRHGFFPAAWHRVPRSGASIRHPSAWRLRRQEAQDQHSGITRGRGGRASLPSNRGLPKIDLLNGALQDAQQHLQPMPGGPTCEKCNAAGRNAHHNKKNCAFAIYPNVGVPDTGRPLRPSASQIQRRVAVSPLQC